MEVKKQDVQHAFSTTYFNRGRRYFVQGKVTSLKVCDETDNDASLEGNVAGSGGRVYSQSIYLENDGYGGLDVDGRCSCPVSFNCKHIVAVCLAFTEHERATGAADWVDKFIAASKAPEIAQTGNKKLLTYCLDRGSVAGSLQVEFHSTQLLKRGGLGKGKPVSIATLHATAYYRRPAYVQEVDIEIVRILLTSQSHSDVCILQGDLGHAALQKMLATGRCFWQQHQTLPLSKSEPREAVQDWQYDDAGNARLTLNVNPHALLVATEPAMYVDVKAGHVGTVKNVNYNAKQLEMLLQAPVVPADKLDAFSQRIALSVPKSVLTPPKAVEMNEVIDALPVPHMLLVQSLFHSGSIRLGRLRFSYDGHDVGAYSEDSKVMVSKDNVMHAITRNMEAEEKLGKRLCDAGMLGIMDREEQEIFYLFHSESDMESEHLWADFMQQTLPELRQEGWQIAMDDDFNMEVVEADAWHADIEEKSSDWFDLRFDVEINGQKQALLPLIAQILPFYPPDGLPETLTLHLGQGKYLNIPSEQVKPVLDVLYELYDHQSLSEDGALKMSRFDAGRVADLEQQNSNLLWRGGENIREVGKQLHDFTGIQDVAVPQGLKAELRHYQQQGLNWLQFLRSYQFNGILADDMGLGKTVQTLAHLLLEKEQGRMDKPCLIVAPTSLMSNWRREAAVFTPELKVLVLQGLERKKHFDSMKDYDLILTTYPLLVRDEEVLMEHEYHLLVLDEAQVVKNPKAKAAKVVRQLKARHKLCLTGTPMENHLGELWALFDFLMPGFLGDTKQFTQVFRTPIEKHGNDTQRQRLVQRIKPFMLRRAKGEVMSELPEKTEMIRTVSLGKKQSALYETIRISMEKKVRDTIANKGLARSHIMILDALLKLRQVCCDPRILSLKQAKKVEESAKLELLMQMLPEMIEEGRKILLFSQFTKMISLIEDELNARNIRYSKLTGQTRKRDEAIEKFKQGEADVFLISLKAGGVGLNLTEADTVIHYDPWWNPAAENQATDRAHRIGQDKAVFVYKLVVENSVEEKIVAMQAKKQALADSVYQTGKKQEELQVTADDMQALFAPL